MARRPVPLLAIALLLGAGLVLSAAGPTPAEPAPAPLAAPVAAPAAAPAAQAADAGKTIVLGFDGMDYNLTRQFMDEGLLPNLSRLAEQGTYQRLETSNPAQSPVSWAVFNTGTNPGKTGVGGFVSRTFKRNEDDEREGIPLPQPMLGFPTEIAADEFVAVPMAMENEMAFLGLAVGAPLLVVFVLLSLIFKLPKLLGIVLGLAAGAGGWVWGMEQVEAIPADGKVPYEINPMQGVNWWNYLDEAGVRLTGIQVASTFPPDDEGPNTRLLSGLGVKDIGGSPGSWFVFTDDPWSWPHQTDTAGDIIKISFDQQDETRAAIELPGPDNWFVDADYKQRIAALEDQVSHRDNTQQDTTALEEELRRLTSEYNKWSKNDKTTYVKFTADVDRAAGTLAFDIAGEQFTLSKGDWSEFVRIEYVFSDHFSAHAVARFHLLECNDEEVRIFVPPVNIDPYHPAEWLPISSPPGFCGDLAHGIDDAYETLGWACMTNPLKDFEDSGFGVQSFLDDIVATEARREQILHWNLQHPADWDVYYQVFSTTDRIGHMLYRETDPEHPLYDKAYAEQRVSAWGREFPLSQSLREVYKEADRIVGEVMAEIDSGSLGDDVLLMLVSDHGFTSFRRGVNLNNLLAEMGYLVMKGDKPVDEVAKGNTELLLYADWERSKAYSMGLGKIFINLEGREPKGIVPQADYDALVAEICDKLELVTDGPGGPKVVTSALSRDELFSGEWVKEGRATRKVRGVEEEVEHDGFADIFLGYAPYYRVSWQNTMGGLDKAGVVDNTKHWSGGHVSVDPEHVPGIFFANRKFSESARSSLLDIGPTVLQHYGIPTDDKDFDGRPLPLAGR